MLSFVRLCHAFFLIEPKEKTATKSHHFLVLVKTAIESHRLFVIETYGEHALTSKTCEVQFRKFKCGDFDFAM